MSNNIEQTQCGNLIIIHEGDKLLDIGDSYKINDEKIKYSKSLLNKIDEFKERGYLVIKENLKEDWTRLINSLFKHESLIHYHCVIIEGSLQCMESLSKEETVENSYKPIDVQNYENPTIHFGMILSGNQNHTATTIVGTYHKRGKEFCDYRNKFVKEH